MRHLARLAVPVVALALAASVAHAQYPVYAVTTGATGAQQLVRFNSGTPGTVTTVGPTGVTLVGIDFRPATGMLYGYAAGQLYTINTTTGVATPTFSVGSATGNVGFDFNPTVDRIRVVSPSGTNLRLNPNDGTTTTDGPYTFAAGDPNFGQTPAFTAVAYSNNDTDPSTGTTLFGIDGTLGSLVMIANPNGGTVSTVGSLGLGTQFTVTGFDIVTVGGANFGFFSTLGAGATPTSNFYSVNLQTGAATLVGAIGATGGVSGIAIAAVPEPGTWALFATGLFGLGVATRRRRSATEG